MAVLKVEGIAIFVNYHILRLGWLLGEFAFTKVEAEVGYKKKAGFLHSCFGMKFEIECLPGLFGWDR